MEYIVAAVFLTVLLGVAMFVAHKVTTGVVCICEDPDD